MAEDSETGSEIVVDERLLADSKKVVEKLLHLREFFATHQDLIFDKLEKADENTEALTKATDAGTGDLKFFEESLPVINGLLQVGVKRGDQMAAEQWVGTSHGNVDPLIVLSALTLIWVAEAGWHAAHPPAEAAGPAATSRRRDPVVWDRILRRVQQHL